jgi:signal transduction histidine kinase
LTSELLHPEYIDALLKRTCESVREIFGFDLVGISILDEGRNVFVLRSFAGYTKEEEQELMRSEMLFAKDVILSDFIDDCRVGNIAYYVPVEKKNASPDDFAVVRHPEEALKPRAAPGLWHELDLLYFALYNRRDELVGYLQVDYPRDGKVPSAQTIEEIELFASLAAVGIENSSMFQQMQQLVAENETKTSRTMRLLSLIRSVLRVDDLNIVLQKVSDSISETFGFRKTGVSMFSKNSPRVTIHSLTGYTEEEERAVRNSTILKDVVLADFKEEFRVTRTGYFIPGESQGDGSSFVFIESPGKVAEPRASPDSWHELDLVCFLMYDRTGTLLGYIQLDYPTNGKIPTKETMEAIEAFASIATIAVENSKMYEDLDQAKTQVSMYLDILTHDVGNLVNPVNAYLEILMATTQLNPMQYKYLSSAQEATKSIIHLLRNVRRSAQMLETTGVELVPVNLSNSVRQTASDARSAFLGKKIEIRQSLPPQDLWVMADNLIDEVFYNIFTNAIKYDEHEEIVVDVSVEPIEMEGKKVARIKISDHGVGIPDEHKDKVFSREFKKIVKADRPSHHRSRGAGMGLSLVKSLVDRYNGKIWVENRVYDDYTRGSVFVIILPRP